MPEEEAAIRDEDEEVSEEARDMVSKKVCAAPTAEEVRVHRLTHVPYRAWCPECVAAKGVDDPHRPRGLEIASELPESHFDYCFLRDQKGAPSVTVIVGKDRRTRCFLGHVVPGKGVKSRWIPQCIERDIRKLGYRGRVLLRSDGEPAIKDLLSEVANMRGVATVLENNPPTDSKSNGLAERAVRSLEEQIRVIKLSFERSTKKNLSVHHPGFTWLVEHCADTLSKCIVDKDGRTAYERVKGRKYHGHVYEFGSVVLHNIPGKPQGRLMSERWFRGVWLGKRWGTDEHIVSHQGSVVRARTVRPDPEGKNWDRTYLTI